MKISNLYVSIVLSTALLFLGGCNTDITMPPQSEIQTTVTSSQRGLFDTHSTIFESITKKLTDDGGLVNGKVDIVGLDKTCAIYFKVVGDIEIDVDFSLSRYKGDLVIAYVSPNATETIIVDTSEFAGDAVDDTVTLLLEKGVGEIELRGNNTIYDFALTFQGFTPDNVSYFDIVPIEKK